MDEIPLFLARDVLRISLSATASSALEDVVGGAHASDGVGLDDPGKDPRFRKLVEAVLFSRRLVLTYNLVLLGLLGVFTVLHWGEKAVLARRRTTRRQGETVTEGEIAGEAWSSSTSTISGTATPPDTTKKMDSADEMALLLPGRPARPRLGYWKPYYMARAWLQYQPAPIPIVNKSLPTNALSVFIVSFIGLNVFYNLYRMPLEAQYLFVFADRCGIIFVANLPLLYLLAAKNQPIKFFTGYSYESLNIFHRRLGELACLEALLHLLGMFGVWYGLLRHLGFSLARFVFNRVVLLGLGAFVAYEVLYFTSLGSFRQRCYEIFLALHIFLQFAGLALLWFHHSQSRPYVGISMGIFLIDRIVFRLWLKSSSHPATLTILDDDETMLLSAAWDTIATSSTLLPQSMAHGWKPNDHIFLTVPTLSRKHTLQAHPFTIFSAAPGPPQPSDPESDAANPNHAWFSLLIRPQSGFTRTLLAHARLTSKLRIRLDGPYGSSHTLDLLSSHSTAIIIAGGSGIAVAYPLLWALLCPQPRTSSVDIVDIEPARPSSVRKQRNVKLLWITHSLDHRSWIPEEKMQELEDWGLEVQIPPPTSVAGRPGVGAVVEEWVVGGRGNARVVVSGPDGLVRDVRNVVAGLLRRGERVSVQIEKFGW